MKFKKRISVLVLIIVLLSGLAASMGIFTNDGPGPFEHQSVRGETVLIYGKGIYKDMSAELAPQGIAQDVVTLFMGIPMLIISLFLARKGLLRGRLLLAGTLGYFLVTYLFYLTMGTFNKVFLVYVVLLCTSFFAFSLTLLSLPVENLKSYFNAKLPVKFVGGYLIFQALMIASLWLERVLPPLVNDTIPLGLQHYTTLIVQGLDLGLLLPIALVGGILLIMGRPFGYLITPVFMIFLTILMTALTAKVVGQIMIGVAVGVPVMIIIPFFNTMTILCAFLILKNTREADFQRTGHKAF